METEDNYIEINKESWNAKTSYHLSSDFYDLKGFLAGNTSLNPIELELLGDVTGKKILHLQCHFGQDTISLGKLGAHVTGIDLSDKAIDSAKDLAKQMNQEATFICCDIYDLPQHLNEQFDIVFTSYGTIGWLPDLDKWASIVSTFLKPGGKFVFVEFHPAVWMYDDDFTKVAYNYFNDGPIIETYEGTYADRNAPISQQYVMWNHSISEVLNNLIKYDLTINSFNEYDYSPYNCLRVTEEVEPKKFRIKGMKNYFPMVYSVVSTKKLQD